MAIDYNSGISSLNAGAPDIKYTGDEGPRSPQQQQQMQQQKMASLMQEYKDYVMQQEEAGRPAMPFEEWVRSIQSPMAYGGTARPTYTQSRKQRMAYGGVAGLDGRRRYGIGSWFQEKIMDPVKKVIPKEIKENPALTAAITGGALNQWGLPIDMFGLEKGAGKNWLGELISKVPGTGDKTIDMVLGGERGADQIGLGEGLGNIFKTVTGQTVASPRKIQENTAITNTGITGKDGVWTPGGMDSSLEAATRYLTGNLPPQLGGSSTLQDAVNYAKGLPTGTSIGTKIKNALLNTGGQDYDEQGRPKVNWAGPLAIGSTMGAIAGAMPKSVLPQDTSGINIADIRRRAKIGSDPGLHFLPPPEATTEYAQGGRIGAFNGGAMVDPRMSQTYAQNKAAQDVQREANLRTRGLGSMPGYESGAEKLLRESQLPQNLRDPGYESGADTALRKSFERIGGPAPTEHDARIARFEAGDWDDTKRGETRLDLLNYYLQHTTGGGGGSKSVDPQWFDEDPDFVPPTTPEATPLKFNMGPGPIAPGTTDPYQLMSGLSAQEMSNLSGEEWDALDQQYENLSQSEKDSLDQQMMASQDQELQNYLDDQAKYGNYYTPQGQTARTVDTRVGRQVYQQILGGMRANYPEAFAKLTGNETLAELDKLMGQLEGHWSKGGRIGAFNGGIQGLMPRRGRIGYQDAGSVLSEEQITQIKQMNGMGADTSTISSITGASEEQINTVLNPPVESQAQGGRIGYDNGGIASMREALKNKGYDWLDDADDTTVKQIFDSEMGTWTASDVWRAQGGRIGAQEGGLMNLGGMEKDYRQEGGFVPLGGEERADDVPARLSKNEFVFTADAVRSAGGGDIDAGAEVMENVMNNLEQGGQISEESQGLEGARDMFATAQRLEGVM